MKTTIDILLLIALATGSYLFGSINSAIIISKLKKDDVRSIGSGNPGTLNMSRNFGIKIGLLVFFLDILKGVIPCLSAYFIFRNRGYFPNCDFRIKDFAIYLCGLFVIVGHIFPLYFKFKGGKGIASSIGVFLFCEFSSGYAWGLVVVMAIVAAAVFIYFTEYGAMGSFIAITPSALGAFIRINVTYYSKLSSCLIFYLMTETCIFLICLLTWIAHRKNIERMLSGDEHATSIKQMMKKKKKK